MGKTTSLNVYEKKNLYIICTYIYVHIYILFINKKYIYVKYYEKKNNIFSKKKTHFWPYLKRKGNNNYKQIKQKKTVKQ